MLKRVLIIVIQLAIYGFGLKYGEFPDFNGSVLQKCTDIFLMNIHGYANKLICIFEY